ncbi:MAG: hypothetical protein ACRC9T_05880, partial [Vibrionaceae bacterium]
TAAQTPPHPEPAHRISVIQSNPAHQASAIQAVSPQSEPTSHTPAPEQAPAAAPQQAAQQPTATAESAITALFLENIPGLQLAPLNPDTRVDLSTVKCLHRGSRFDFSMAMRLSFNTEEINKCENQIHKYLLKKINKETLPYVRLRLLVLAFVRFYNTPKINQSRCAEFFGMPTTTISSWCEDFLNDHKYQTEDEVKELIVFMRLELKKRGVIPSQPAAPRRMPQPLATATTTRAQTAPEHTAPLQQLLAASPKAPMPAPVPMPHQLSNLPAIPSAPSVHRQARQHLGPRPKPYSATLRQKPIQPRPQQPQKTTYVLIAQQELQQLQQQLQQQQEQLRQQQLLLQHQQLLLQQLQTHQPPQLPTVLTFIPQPQPQQPIPQAQTVTLRFAPQPQQAQQAQQQEQEQEQMEQEEDLQARRAPEVAHSPQTQPKEHKE